MSKEAIEKYIDDNKDKMIQDICTLVRIKSDRQPAKEGMPYGEGPYQALHASIDIAKNMGFETKNYDNYVCAIDMNNKPAQLDILAHLDVVPAEGEWKMTAPYEPKVIGNKLYGRGTSDDKGPAICALYAMKAIKDLGIELSKNVRLILGTDEECGSSDIKYYYSFEEEAPMSFSPDAEYPVINIEKGHLQSKIMAYVKDNTQLPRIASMKGGSKINIIPDLAQAVVEGLDKAKIEEYISAFEQETKLKCELEQMDGNKVKISIIGYAGHASMPEKFNNSVTGLLDFVSRLPIAKGDAFDKICAIAELFPHGDYYGEAVGVKQSDELSGELTICLDMISFDGENLCAEFDSRCPICANDDNMRLVIKEKCEQRNLTLSDDLMRPSHHVDENSPFIQTLLDCYTEYTGNKGECIAIGGGTYVHDLKNGVAFGCGMQGTDYFMHGNDEFANIDELVLSAKIFAQVILRLCK